MASGIPKVDTALSSWQDVERHEVAILSRLQAEPLLTLAALANPLLALEELGYQIDDELKLELEDRLRFPMEYERVAKLRRKIFESAGATFSLDSPRAVHEMLSGLMPADVARHLTTQDVTPEFELPGVPKREGSDPLERFSDAHPVIKLLVKYRGIQAKVPPFATRAVYDEVRLGRRHLPISNAVVSTGRNSKQRDHGQS